MACKTSSAQDYRLIKTAGRRHRVTVIYTHFPHYRKPVFDALSHSRRFYFDFHYDSAGVESTIVNGVSDRSNHHQMRSRRIGPFLWQSEALLCALREKADAFIFLGNPFILSNWLAAMLARARGIPVFFWTHGWVRNEIGMRDRLRGLFYRFADGLLLYGDRAKMLGIERGFGPEKLHVIGNSLDYEKQARLRDKLLSEPRSLSRVPLNKPYFLVVARLVESAGISLAIEAIGAIHASVALVVIGDGPCREKLEVQARKMGVDVRFEGALYAEEDLASYFLNCVAVVSPGKVGLLAMHALAYGAAIITHGNPDLQMPEFEAIEEGVTGAFFEYGNACDLALALQAALDQPSTELSVAARRRAAIATIENKYTPRRQVELIEAALLSQGVGADG
jgi:glycosyltransferase involved in cell wall biosynthesis